MSLACGASAVAAQFAARRRRANSASTRCASPPGAPAWESVGQLDVSRLGMWDTPGVEGPSCTCIRGPVENEELWRCEALYLQARDSYFAGHPHVADWMFDRLEGRLRLAGSLVARKYPRCSLRSRQKYSDATADTSQMVSLTFIWLALLSAGSALAVASLLQSDALGLAGTRSPAAPALAGAALVAVSLRALHRVHNSTLVALKGDCPSCGEEVYAFVQASGAGMRHAADCHVCARPLRFDVRVAGAAAPPWRRRAAGRITLVTSDADFFPAITLRKEPKERGARTGAR